MTHHYARKRPRMMVPDGAFHRRLLGKAFGALLLLHQSAKLRFALRFALPAASAMAAPKKFTSNGGGFRRRNGIAQALRNKKSNSPPSCAPPPPPCLPGARRAAVWPVSPGGVLYVGRRTKTSRCPPGSGPLTPPRFNAGVLVYAGPKGSQAAILDAGDTDYSMLSITDRTVSAYQPCQ
jgi:hypothetical protein